MRSVIGRKKCLIAFGQICQNFHHHSHFPQTVKLSLRQIIPPLSRQVSISPGPLFTPLMKSKIFMIHSLN